MASRNEQQIRIFAKVDLCLLTSDVGVRDNLNQ